MEPLKHFNLAMHYIELNLAGGIEFTKVAQLAGCSEYHFRRMFSFLSGMSLSEYIRCRRLSQAALELRQGQPKVIDLAVKYGYESADAFSRAFQSWHGITPSEARQEGVLLKAIPPMTFQLTIQGGTEMDYRIIEKEAFYIVGIQKRVPLIYSGVNPHIAEMWASFTEEDIAELEGLPTVEPQGLLNASVNFTEGRAEGTELDHWIGVATPAPIGKWQALAVPASTWGVFTAKGQFPDELQRVWASIYSEWFPISGYEHSPGPEMVWIEDKDYYHSEIWIPLVKK